MIFTRIILLKGLLFAVAHSSAGGQHTPHDLDYKGMAEEWKSILQANKDLMKKVTLWECEGGLNKIEECGGKDGGAIGKSSTKIYERMLDASPDLQFLHNPSDNFKVIDSDVWRSRHSMGEDRVMECRQVLISFFIFDRETNIVQGMIQIVSVFLRVGMKADDALKCFVGFIDRMCTRECYLRNADGMAGARTKTDVLAQLLPFSSKWGSIGAPLDYATHLKGRVEYEHGPPVEAGPAGQPTWSFFQDFGIAQPEDPDAVVSLFNYMITNQRCGAQHPAMIIFAVKIAMLDNIVEDIEANSVIEQELKADKTRYENERLRELEANAQINKSEWTEKDREQFQLQEIERHTEHTKRLQDIAQKLDALRVELRGRLPSEFLADLKEFRKGPAREVKNGKLGKMTRTSQVIKDRINEASQVILPLTNYGLSMARVEKIITWCEKELGRYNDLIQDWSKKGIKTGVLNHLSSKRYPKRFPIIENEIPAGAASIMNHQKRNSSANAGS